MRLCGDEGMRGKAGGGSGCDRMAVPLQGRVQVTGVRGQGAGHGRDGFAGTKVRFFELWRCLVLTKIKREFTLF